MYLLCVLAWSFYIMYFGVIIIYVVCFDVTIIHVVYVDGSLFMLCVLVDITVHFAMVVYLIPLKDCSVFLCDNFIKTCVLSFGVVFQVHFGVVSHLIMCVCLVLNYVYLRGHYIVWYFELSCILAS